MAYDIFISYRRDGGKELARPLKSELELRGYRVFLDFDELKDGVFDRRIMEAIDAAPIFMVILSPHALDRCANADDWVRREIEYALEHDRHFIPIDPDRSFTGFPPDIPDTLKAGLGQHQFSQVMFEQLFKVSVDKMVRERIEPLLQRAGRTAMQEQGGALFHVETDLPCRILKFGKELCTVRPGSDTVIRLRKGRHKLEAVCLDCPDDRLQWVQTVEDNEMEDLLTVELRPVRERRLAAEADVLAERGQTAYDAGDYAEAVKLWCEAAEAGNRIAQNSLGDCYYYGKGVAKDYTEAVKWYRKAAEQGYASAQNNLGWCYKHGYGVEQDDAEAVKWYRKAAEQGYDSAQNNLGTCYHWGKGVEQDYAEAVKWYRKAAEQGNAAAQNNLGWCYQNGKGVEQDYAEAVKWYRKAAEQGNAAAQNNLGWCYQNGKGVEQDYAEAVKWYRKAAEQGYASAQNNLGTCYHWGKGVEQDDAEAVKWFRKAVEQGDAVAQKNLGGCYYDGEGVEQDYAEAVKWYRKAAEQGYAVAQFEMGWCYKHGYGVPKDLAEAKRWYRKAADAGIQEAKKHLAELGR